MKKKEIKELLESVESGNLSSEEALEVLKDLPFKDLGHTKIDYHRELRKGYPEVVFCSGKTVEQVRDIMTEMYSRKSNILGTRATAEMYEAVKQNCPEAVYNELGKTISIDIENKQPTETYISIVTAGTSDIPVDEEAYVTCDMLGNEADRIYDVGVAGIHRLLANTKSSREPG